MILELQLRIMNQGLPQLRRIFIIQNLSSMINESSNIKTSLQFEKRYDIYLVKSFHFPDQMLRNPLRELLLAR